MLRKGVVVVLIALLLFLPPLNSSGGTCIPKETGKERNSIVWIPTESEMVNERLTPSIKENTKTSRGRLGELLENLSYDGSWSMQRIHFLESRYQVDELLLREFQRTSLQIQNLTHSKKSPIHRKQALEDGVIYVPDDYPTIQSAVENATEGDTIIVRDGVYIENIVIYKSCLTIRSENGPENCIVKAESPLDFIFSFYGSNITLRGFTIMNGFCGVSSYNSLNKISNNSISNSKYGIFLAGSSNNEITNNSIYNELIGVGLYYSSNNKISNNSISNSKLWGIHLNSSNNEITNNSIYNGFAGIGLYYSSNNKISNNNISNNELVGVGFLGSSNNKISNNNISNNGGGVGLLDSSNNNEISNNAFIRDGIFITNSYQNTIERNIVNGKPLVYLEEESDAKIDDAGQVILVKCNNIEVTNLNLSNTDVGIELLDCNNCIIKSNTILNNNLHGIDLLGSSNNEISSNNISNNSEDGVELSNSTNNEISNNSISNNGRYGISLYGSSSSNIIYLNSFVNNTWNAWGRGGRNQWDNGSVGNYWSNQWYAIDLDNDGISDIPYLIPPLFIDKDRYPLMGHGPRADIYLDVRVPSQGYLYVDNHEQRKLSGNKTIVFALPRMDPLEIQVHAGGPYGIEGVTGYIDYDENHPEEVDFVLTRQRGDTYTCSLNKVIIGTHTLSIVAYDRFHNHKMVSIPIFFFYIPRL